MFLELKNAKTFGIGSSETFCVTINTRYIKKFYPIYSDCKEIGTIIILDDEPGSTFTNERYSSIKKRIEESEI